MTTRTTTNRPGSSQRKHFPQAPVRKDSQRKGLERGLAGPSTTPPCLCASAPRRAFRGRQTGLGRGFAWLPPFPPTLRFEAYPELGVPTYSRMPPPSAPRNAHRKKDHIHNNAARTLGVHPAVGRRFMPRLPRVHPARYRGFTPCVTEGSRRGLPRVHALRYRGARRAGRGWLRPPRRRGRVRQAASSAGSGLACRTVSRETARVSATYRRRRP